MCSNQKLSKLFCENVPALFAFPEVIPHMPFIISFTAALPTPFDSKSTFKKKKILLILALFVQRRPHRTEAERRPLAKAKYSFIRAGKRNIIFEHI